MAGRETAPQLARLACRNPAVLQGPLAYVYLCSTGPELTYGVCT